jgi:hypothetical protein
MLCILIATGHGNYVGGLQSKFTVCINQRQDFNRGNRQMHNGGVFLESNDSEY